MIPTYGYVLVTFFNHCFEKNDWKDLFSLNSLKELTIKLLVDGSV